MRLAIALFLPIALAAQSKPEEPATVSGTVTNSVTGEPLRRALVSLRKTTVSRNTTTITSAESAYTHVAGRYTLTGVAPGDYSINAERSGFISQGYGSRTPGGA